MAAQNDTKEHRLEKFKTDLQKLVNKTLIKGDAWYGSPASLSSF